MSTRTTPESEPTPPSADVMANAIGDRIAEGIAKGLQSLAPKKKTIGQYAREHARTVKLRCEVWQNGIRVMPDTLSDEEIELLNKLRIPGRYLNRRVEVLIVTTVDNQDTNIEIRYSDRSVDHRLENSKLFVDFADMLRKIVAEQATKPKVVAA